MKLARLSLLSVFLAAQAAAAGVSLSDVSDASHPKPLENQVGEVRIVSESNSNSRHSLSIHALHRFTVPPKQILLTVGKQTIRFNAQDRDTNGVYAISATLEDPTIVPQIAQHFHATVLERRHPGYQMLAEFIPAKPAFTAGEPVLVTLRITNVGQRDFAFEQGGRQRGARDNQFAFSAEKIGERMLPDSGVPLHYGGLGSTVTLKPSESHEIKVDLTKWFKFEPGSQYLVRGSYYMGFVDPRYTSADTIWEGYACGEFILETKR